MAVFRAEDPLPEDEIDSSDEEDLEDDETLLEPQPADDVYAAEREGLLEQGARFDDTPDYPNPTTYYQPQASGDERVLLQDLEEQEVDQPKSRRQLLLPTRQKGILSSKAKRKVLAGLGMFMGPTLIGLVLLILALQLGFTLEHVKRITTGIRYGSMHVVLSKRFNHLRREHVRSNIYNDGTDFENRHTRYTRTTLGQRLLGVTPDTIFNNLRSQGVEFEYKALGGSSTTLGRRTLTTVKFDSIDPATGKSIKTSTTIKNSKQALEVLDNIKNVSFDDTELGRYRAHRAAMITAQQIGIPFLRFRYIIRSIRDGTYKNLIRGAPAAFSQRIDEALINGKSRLLTKLPVFKARAERLGIDNLDETLASARSNVGTRTNLTERLKGLFDGKQGVFAAASAASAAVAVLTLACIIRELGSMITQSFKMKVRGMQDNAAAVLTTTSQIRAGDIEEEVISDMTQRFNGFATSANYQASINPALASSYVGVEGADFSQELNPSNVFNGTKVKSLMTISNLLNPKNIVNSIANVIPQMIHSGGVWGQIFSGLLGLFKSTLGFVANQLNSAFNKVCDIALTSTAQIAIAAIELVATAVAIIMSAGSGAFAIGGLRAYVKVILTQVALPFLAGAALDIYIFDHLLPGIVENATGLDTALLSEPNNIANGARNYASVDYGMHYLKESEALNQGGSRLDLETGFNQAQAFIAQERQGYLAQGLWSNIVSLDNPYSFASTLAVSQQAGSNLNTQTVGYLSSIFTNLKTVFDVSQPVLAQSQADQEAWIQLMYPGQSTVIGFHEAEMSGDIDDFKFIENTEYVENNLTDLYQEYSKCLTIDVSDYLLDDLGVSRYDDDSNDDGERYPQECDSKEARHYKTYYQDCTLIDGLNRWGTNTSPMFSSTCDELLPPETQELLNSTSELSYFNKIHHLVDLLGIDDLHANTLATTTEMPSNSLDDIANMKRPFWFGIQFNYLLS